MAYSVDTRHPVVPTDSTSFTHNNSTVDKKDYEEFWKTGSSFINTCLTVLTNECVSKIIENRKPWVDAVIKSFLMYGCVCLDDTLQTYDMSIITIYFKTNEYATNIKKFENQTSIIG